MDVIGNPVNETNSLRNCVAIGPDAHAGDLGQAVIHPQDQHQQRDRADELHIGHVDRLGRAVGGDTGQRNQETQHHGQRDGNQGKDNRVFQSAQQEFDIGHSLRSAGGDHVPAPASTVAGTA